MYVASLAAFLLALLAKTSVVMLPAVLLLCAWWRRGRVTAADLRRAAPYFALSAILGAVTAWYQSQRAIGSLVVRDDGLASRLALAGRAVWFYLGKALLPVDLAFVYPRWRTGDVSGAAWLPLLLLVALFALLWAGRRGWGRPLLFALTYFVLGLLPVLGFLDIYFMRYSLVADHWQYVSLLGIAALAGAGLARLGARLGPAAGGAVGAALVAVLGVATWRQQAPYRDVQSLWTDTVAKNPDAWLAHNNLGGMLLLSGQPAEAAAHFEAALRGSPDDVGIRANWGESLLALQRFDEAAAVFEEVLRRQPDRAAAHDSLGLALLGLGRGEEAVAAHEAALRLQPGNAVTHNHLGNALYALGRLEQAAAQYREATRLDPQYAEAHNNLGNADFSLHRLPEAVADYQAALAIRPRYAEAASNLGSAYKELGRLDEAIAQYEAALAMKPELTGVLDNLIPALRSAGRGAEADALAARRGRP
jgi:tetratricopeptide (TPR) repeat protein